MRLQRYKKRMYQFCRRPSHLKANACGNLLMGSRQYRWAIDFGRLRLSFGRLRG